MYDFAAKYAFAHAAASCLHMARFSRNTWRDADLPHGLNEFFASLRWLPHVLARLERRYQTAAVPIQDTSVEAVTEVMLNLHENARAFSILPHAVSFGPSPVPQQTDSTTPADTTTRLERTH